MKKLRLVTDHHLNSGIGRYSFELSKALLAERHDVELFKPSKSNSVDRAFEKQYPWIKKIKYRSFRSLHAHLLPFFIGGRLLTTSADVFHAHWFMAGLGLVKAAKKKVVVTMHDVSLLHEREKTGSFLTFYQKALKTFKERELPIIVVSEQAKKDTITYAGFRENQVHAIYNGINNHQFFAKNLERQAGSFKLIYSGGLAPRKNLDLLLQACKILEDRRVDYQMTIAGNHPEATPYPKMCATLKLKNVRFAGFIPEHEMNDFYNRADLMIYTSKYEGFGFSPLEAMATGLPVICTKGGSLAEVSGGGALMVNDDAEEIAEQVVRLKEDETLYEKYQIKGQSWVAQYSWKNTALNTLEVYKSIAP